MDDSSYRKTEGGKYFSELGFYITISAADSDAAISVAVPAVGLNSDKILSFHDCGSLRHSICDATGKVEKCSTFLDVTALQADRQRSSSFYGCLRYISDILLSCNTA